MKNRKLWIVSIGFVGLNYFSYGFGYAQFPDPDFIHPCGFGIIGYAFWKTTWERSNENQYQGLLGKHFHNVVNIGNSDQDDRADGNLA